LGRLKYKTSVFFFKIFTTKKFFYTKVYEIVLNGGFFAWVFYADADWDGKNKQAR